MGAVNTKVNQLTSNSLRNHASSLADNEPSSTEEDYDVQIASNRIDSVDGMGAVIFEVEEESAYFGIPLHPVYVAWQSD